MQQYDSLFNEEFFKKQNRLSMVVSGTDETCIAEQNLIYVEAYLNAIRKIFDFPDNGNYRLPTPVPNHGVRRTQSHRCNVEIIRSDVAAKVSFVRDLYEQAKRQMAHYYFGQWRTIECMRHSLDALHVSVLKTLCAHSGVIVDICVAMAALQLPPYVYLEICDYVVSGPLNRAQRIAIIEEIICGAFRRRKAATAQQHQMARKAKTFRV